MAVKRTAAWLIGLLFVAFGAGKGVPEPSPESVIERFAARESEFRDVWRNYTYTQRILFQVLGRRGQPVEQRELIAEVFFNSEGNRETRVVSDRGGLSSLTVTREDLSDAMNMQPFVLTTEELSEYQIKYQGKERVDELDTFVFDVKPEKMVKGKRYFKGRIWVDDQDFQIVMTRGKIEPDLGNNKFPKFETVREQIDGEYWFPTWTLADDVLHFGDGWRSFRSTHVKVLITYTDFKKYEVGTTIRYGPPAENDPQD